MKPIKTTIIDRLLRFRAIQSDDVIYDEDTQTIRYRYWEKLPHSIAELFPELTLIEIDEDEDCGLLHCYKVKENK